MKTSFIALICIIGAAKARPQNPYHHSYITKYYNDNPGFGRYQYGFETSHGSRHDESGEVRNVGSEHESLAVRGSYSYVGPDGVTYTVHYVADQNGFQPQGEHLPPSAGVKKLGMPLCSAAQATLCGGGVG
ncbi:hypothetical protein MTP99_010223 [Tenebrio molitor]|nr:hypothetical protein MTP99_010223 [Tenebrio molitor]